MNKATNAALHTLWQAAVAGGGIGEIAKSVTDHSVNLPGVEQGVILALASVGAAGLALLRHAGLAWIESLKKKGSHREQVAAVLDQIVADYQQTHSTDVGHSL